MASPPRPVQPMLVVLGSTGTGKSDLAVELATRFNGEVINADAMQLYDGLPIITNKITPSEQRGVPHHLLGHIPLDALPWDVDEFRSHAERTIRDIRARGKLPIVVGGTQYYVDSLLFRDILLDDVQSAPGKSFPVLDEATDVILQRLREVDPDMASRWHPNDRRKIQRSLEIYLSTGKRASELYAEQEARRAVALRDASTETEPWDKLLLWVYSERSVLCERLDRRVDKMLDTGLMDEVKSMYEYKQQRTAAGSEVDLSKGIWQSIGYRQFEPYLAAANENNSHNIPDSSSPASTATNPQALHRKALEDMKTATRRYANYQNRWTRLKQIPRLREQGGPAAVRSLYVLDSTDASSYASNVVEPAAALTAQFLAGDAGRPLPVDLSDFAREVLTSAAAADHCSDSDTEAAGARGPREVPCQRTCEVCGTTVMTERDWTRHVKSAGHNRVLKRKKRLALVPTEPEGEAARRRRSRGHKADPGESGSDSGPDISSMFEHQ